LYESNDQGEPMIPGGILGVIIIVILLIWLL
jgi:hypothetical protein